MPRAFVSIRKMRLAEQGVNTTAPELATLTCFGDNTEQNTSGSRRPGKGPNRRASC